MLCPEEAPLPSQDKDAKKQATLGEMSSPGEGPTEAEELRREVTLKASEQEACSCLHASLCCGKFPFLGLKVGQAGEQ